MAGTYWEVDESAALTTQVRALLVARYGYTADPTHTYAALISVREVGPGRDTCLVTFPFSFRAADYVSDAAGLEDLIAAECATRLRALRNAAGLAAIAGRRHWL